MNINAIAELPYVQPIADASVLLKARMRYTRMFIALLIPIVAVTASRWPEHSLSHEIMQWSGHVLIVIGVLARIFSSLYIGGRKNDDLISDGPFSILRNPLYVGSFIAITGLGLLTTSVTITALLCFSFAFCYQFTVAREELFLHRKFGVRYGRYAQRVPRWIPRFKLWQNPGELNVKPYFVLRTILDSSLFLLAIPLLETMSELREQGILPTLLTLP